MIGNAELWHGDCREVLPLLDSVGAVVTDPPFNVGKDYGVHDDAMPETEYLAWMAGVIAECKRLSRQQWFVVPTSKMLAFWLMLPAAEQVVIPMSAGYAIRSGWTQKYAAMLVEGKPPGNPWNVWEGIRHRGEGYFFREDTFGHPGYTPLGIMERAVKTSGADVVLDPFLGTGTTGIAAAQVGCRFVGIEINRAYFDIACERISHAQAQGTLLVPEEPAQPVQEGLL